MPIPAVLASHLVLVHAVPTFGLFQKSASIAQRAQSIRTNSMSSVLAGPLQTKANSRIAASLW